MLRGTPNGALPCTAWYCTTRTGDVAPVAMFLATRPGTSKNVEVRSVWSCSYCFVCDTGVFLVFLLFLLCRSLIALKSYMGLQHLSVLAFYLFYRSTVYGQ